MHSVCTIKDAINKMKSKSTEREKLFVNEATDRSFI